MDAAYLETFRARSAAEAARTAPPEGFPKLPDLQLGRYTDPAFAELERERLWKRVWLYAAHDSELEGNGSYKTIDPLGAPVVLVRGNDGVVRAFLNVCRHRGAPVARGGCGTAKLLVCQYHSWGYDLEGQLKRVPDERDFGGLEPENRGLVPIRCESWGGWHFINFDQDAGPLLEHLDPLPRLLPEVAAAPLRLLDHTSVVQPCNWKVLAEAFLEVYHARTVHPTTVAPTVDTKGTVITLYDHGHQSMLSPVIPGTRNDSREALPMWEGVTDVFTAGIQPAHGIFPNLISPLDARGFPFLTFWPLAVDSVRLDITWFATDWGGGEHPQREIWEQRLARFDKLMDEDYLNLLPVQKSMEFAGHGGQVINYQERRIWHIHAWIDKVIGAEHIPEALRVPDLLADWVTEVPAGPEGQD